MLRLVHPRSLAFHRGVTVIPRRYPRWKRAETKCARCKATRSKPAGVSRPVANAGRKVSAACDSGLNSQLHSARRGLFPLSRSPRSAPYPKAQSHYSTFSRKDLYAFSGNPAARPRSPRTSSLVTLSRKPKSLFNPRRRTRIGLGDHYTAPLVHTLLMSLDIRTSGVCLWNLRI